MKEIKAPERYVRASPARRSHWCPGWAPPMNSFERALFVAGGISNCPDWQAWLATALVDTEVFLLNPRRGDFDATNPTMEQEQIEWEHQHLLLADAYLFWFCEETLCPITLFELGKVAGMFPAKPLFVGTHQHYSRKRDVSIQLSLMRPEVNIVHCLDKVSDQVIEWDKSFRRNSP